jgi:hypothetical protein
MAENHVAGTNNLEGLEALNNETVDLVSEEEKKRRCVGERERDE